MSSRFPLLPLAQDLPASLLPHVAEPGHALDTMLEVKEFMASPSLCQPIEIFLHAGAARDIDRNPSTVLPRRPISKDYARQVQHFLRELEVAYPGRQEAQDYVQGWLTRSTTEGLRKPLALHFLQRTLGNQSQPPLATLMGQLVSLHPVKHVSITRPAQRKVQAGTKRQALCPEEIPSFEEYLAQRVSQGVEASTAQAEWNGMCLMSTAADDDHEDGDHDGEDAPAAVPLQDVADDCPP